MNGFYYLNFVLFFFEICSYGVPTYFWERNITIPITSSGYDPCRYFQLYNSTLYRLGQSNIIESWNVNNFSYTSLTTYYTSNWLTIKVKSLALGKKSGYLIALISNTNYVYLNSLTLKQASGKQNATSIKTFILQKVQSTLTQNLQIGTISGINYLGYVNKSSTSETLIAPILSGVITSILSTDEQTLLIWDSNGHVSGFIFNPINSSWQNSFNYFPPLITYKLMNSIALSDNGSIAIFQYDSVNSLVVYNVTSHSIIAQFRFNNTIINQVLFLDKECQLISVFFNGTSMSIYDTMTLTLKSTQNFLSVSNYSAIDYSTGKIYLCQAGNISVFNFQCPSPYYHNMTTNKCEFVQINQIQAFVTNMTIYGLSYISPVITTVFLVIQIGPFAILFLNLINFWNLSSFYTMAKIKGQNYLPTAHKVIFQATQTTILSLFGINLTLPYLNSRQTPKQFAFDYQISIDFFNSNLQNLISIASAIGMVLILRFINKILISKKYKVIKNFLTISILDTLLYQFASFLPFCIIPFRYIPGQTFNFSQKFNLILQYFLLFTCILTPFVFLWTLIQKNNKKKKIHRELAQKQNILNRRFNVINQEDQQKFFMFFNSLIIPLLITLQSPLPFLIINFFIFLYEVKLSFRSQRYKIIKIMFAFYVLTYHFCYIIFYLFEQSWLIQKYVEMLALFILLIGGIHELLSFFITNLIQFIIWIKRKKPIQSILPNKVNDQRAQGKNKQIHDQNLIKSIEIDDQQAILGKKIRYKIVKKTNKPKIQIKQSANFSLKIRMKKALKEKLPLQITYIKPSKSQ